MVNVKLADIPIRMHNRFPDLEYLCVGYETKEEPQIELSVFPEELEQERSMQADVFTDGYLETVCMYRKLALEVLSWQVFVFHASIIDVDGEGYGFLAPSGTGKTTQTRLWLEYFGERARVVNGDKPLIRAEETESGWQFTAYGTPWCGKESMGCNASVTLKALFLLERAPKPSCERASEEYSIDRLFRQMLLPEDPEQMEQQLTLADKLVENVPCYVLRCNMEMESLKVAYEAVQRKV